MNNELYGNLVFGLSHPGRRAYSLPENRFGHHPLLDFCKREKDAELPECDEVTVVRHYTNHSENNFGADNGFYPLGSCTMKYDPVINEEITSMPCSAALHPHQPVETVQDTLEVKYNIQRALASITGMAEVTLDPYTDAHGELTGLMLIVSYHQQRGDTKRTRVIVPDSAHDTNPVSATVYGLEIVEVKSTAEGLVDVNDLKSLLGDDTAGMMMTDPDTLGLFERDIPEIAKFIHDCDGLLYYDGADLNPLLSAARPGDMGFDVIHLNLHKTFFIPHGGDGPGAGPVGVAEKLIPFLPKSHVKKTKDGFVVDNPDTTGEFPSDDIRISGYLGSFLTILRAYTYILTLGREHLKEVGPFATLNADYIRECLKDDYELPIDILCKHEFVSDGLEDKGTGVTTIDVAKRLLDYDYHAPTIYFLPLFHEATMIELTETESKDTTDGFIEVMHAIAKEVLENPELAKGAPYNAPIGRVDDVLTAKHPILTYRRLINDIEENA